MLYFFLFCQWLRFELILALIKISQQQHTTRSMNIEPKIASNRSNKFITYIISLSYTGSMFNYYQSIMLDDVFDDNWGEFSILIISDVNFFDIIFISTSIICNQSIQFCWVIYKMTISWWNILHPHNATRLVWTIHWYFDITVFHFWCKLVNT